MTASPRSPSPAPAPSGTVRASSAFGIKKIDRRWRLCHEASFRQIGPLRDLYEDRRLADHDIVRKVGAGHRLRCKRPSRTMMVIAVAPHAARYATAAFLFGEPRLNAPNRKSRSGKCAHQAFAKSNRR